MARILIVDDDSLNQQLLVQLLGSNQHTTLVASDGEEGLALARAERPDLIISDVLMPTMDGYEFVRHVRADTILSQTRVIFITGYYLSREARALANTCGINYIIYKPCAKEEILRIVEAALQSERPQESATSLSRNDFDREHMLLLTDKLSDEADDLIALNHKLTAMIDLSQ
jgi:two-component system cell cycle sensor histidine kinase/response regulator CckA